MATKQAKLSTSGVKCWHLQHGQRYGLQLWQASNSQEQCGHDTL